MELNDSNYEPIDYNQSEQFTGTDNIDDLKILEVFGGNGEYYKYDKQYENNTLEYLSGDITNKYTDVFSKEPKHVCGICSKRFHHASKLSIHSFTHTKESPYNSSTCSEMFSSLPNHKLQLRKSFQCPFCPKKYPYKSRVSYHIMTHTGEKPFECPICHKFFKSGISNHIKLHSEERPYTCPTCSKKFVCLSLLKQHYRIHTGKRTYCCSICSKKFSKKYKLDAHIKSHIMVRRKKPSPILEFFYKYKSVKNEPIPPIIKKNPHRYPTRFKDRPIESNAQKEPPAPPVPPAIPVIPVREISHRYPTRFRYSQLKSNAECYQTDVE